MIKTRQTISKNVKQLVLGTAQLVRWIQQVEEGETTIEAVGLQEQIKSLNIKFVKCFHLIVPIN